MSSNTLCSLQYEPSKEPSYVVSFSNGTLKATDNDVNFKLYGRKDGNYPNKRILVANTKHLDYIGQTFGDNATRYSNNCKYYVGVRNKKTGKMVVKDAMYLRLHPKTIDDDFEKDDPELSYQDKKDMLTSAFGSKKKQRSLASRLKFEVNSQEIDSVMSKTVGNISFTSEPESPQKQSGSEILPPINVDSLSVENVFNIDDIVTPKELDAISEEEINSIKDVSVDTLRQWIQENRYSDYMFSQIGKLPIQANQRLKKIRLLIYIECLYELLKVHHSALQKKDPLPSVPEVIKKCLLERFTQGTGSRRKISAQMKDKICIHILILALFVEKYTIQINQMQIFLKLKTDKIMTIIRALGLKIVSPKNSTEKVAALKLPIVLPTRSGGKRGRQ